MPSGTTHDAITILLAPGVAGISYASADSFSLAVFVTGAFLFGGLMFGPDLDTVSKQYSRWSIAKLLWYPYTCFFKHRSRWSHGLIFGTFLRVVYFMGVLTLAAFIATWTVATFTGGNVPDLFEFGVVWRRMGEYVSRELPRNAISAVFIGMWLGAASHTLTDMAGSYVKTGRVTKLF